MMNRTVTVPFIWEDDCLNANAIRIMKNEDVNIKYCYIMQKLHTMSEGKWYPVEFRNTGDHFESDPIWEVTYRF